MKKTQHINLLRSIKKNGVSFFAVAFIAATSIAIFTGIRATGLGILEAANRHFLSQNVENMEVACINGITDDDIDALINTEEIDVAEGSYSCMASYDNGSETMILQVRSIGTQINIPVVCDGVLPTGENEVAVEECFALNENVNIGDTLTVRHKGELLSESFTVTAIINDPLYCYTKVSDIRGKTEIGTGNASYYISVTKDTFDSEYYDNCYTTAHIKSGDMDGIFAYSDEYNEKSAILKQKLESLGIERSAIRYNLIKDKANSAISDAESDISEAENKISDASQQIKDAQIELDTVHNEIKSALIAIGMSGDFKEALDLIGDSPNPIKSTIETYYEQAKELESKKEELKTSKADLDEAKAKLLDAKSDASEIQQQDWVVLERNTAGDLRSIETIVDSIYGLSYSFAVIFLIVAIIVCYTAIAKMISEQRTLIGAQKALGFTSKEILKHYMLYNILCSISGIIIGFVAGVYIVEILVMYIFSKKLLIKDLRLIFDFGIGAIVALICLAIFIIATYVACAKLVKIPAIDLLRGEVPKKGKKYFFENFKVYKKLSLYSHTMIKNLITDKSRIVTTIAGVIGCISLLVICFSIKFATSHSAVKQFDEYFMYDYRLITDSTANNTDGFKKFLDDENVEYTIIQDKLKSFRTIDGSLNNLRIVTAKNQEAIDDYMIFKDIINNKVITLPNDGVLISRKISQKHKLYEGDSIEIMDSKGNSHSFKISGVIEHFLSYHMVVTSNEYYEKVMGESADTCVFLLKGNVSGYSEKLREMDGFLSMRDNSEFNNTASSIDLVIAVCLTLSAVMALLVLLNQIVMHINKKSRELAVMRINGYTIKETKRFVYIDNILLTVAGLVLGSVFGAFLSYFVIQVLESEVEHFDLSGTIMLSCLYASIVGIVFTFVVNVIALRKIKHINLTKVSEN